MKRIVYGVSEEGSVLDTQRKMVKDYLLTSGKPLSHMDCERMFGFTRLSAIIFDLKDQFAVDGEYEVKDEFRQVPNRYGRTSRVKFYWVEKTNKIS